LKKLFEKTFFKKKYSALAFANIYMGSSFCCVSNSTQTDVESVEESDCPKFTNPRLSHRTFSSEFYITVEPGNSPLRTPSLIPTTARTMWISSPSYSSYVPTPMTKVLPHLYLGSYDNATNEQELFEKNITHILSLIGPRNTLEIKHYKKVPMNDYGRTDLKEVLEKVTNFVEEGQQDGHNLLIHCQSGQNRSATVVIALQMIYQKKTLYEAHKELKRIRPIVHINVEYAKQLIALEKEILGKSSLPPNWMERRKLDTEAGVVTYMYENLSTIDHRSLQLF